MSSFHYKALQRDGSLAEGDLDGATRGEATRRLNEQGMQILSLVERKGAAAAKAPKAKPDAKAKPGTKGGPGAGTGTAAETPRKAPKAPPENRLSSKHLIQFTEELSDLLAAGVQLDTALASIARRSESQAIARVAGLCHEKVRDGVPLATALRTSSPSFNDLYCNLVSAGEVSGALGDILKRQVAYLTTLADLRGKMVTAMIYPAFLVIAGAGVMVMFATFLIPKLQDLIETTGGKLPPVAGVILGSTDFLKSNWVGVLVFLAAALVVGVLLFQRPSVRYAWDREKLKLPFFGRLMLTRFNVQFVETLSNLLANGLPLVRSLELVENTTPNRHIRVQLETIRERVADGALLNRSMEKAGVFDSGLLDMVRIGEDTGHLTTSMSKAGARLDRELDRSIERIASVIQPVIILVMSVVVGAMVYLMLSIIYETLSVLRNRM